MSLLRLHGSVAAELLQEHSKHFVRPYCERPLLITNVCRPCLLELNRPERRERAGEGDVTSSNFCGCNVQLSTSAPSRLLSTSTNAVSKLMRVSKSSECKGQTTACAGDCFPISAPEYDALSKTVTASFNLPSELRPPCPHSCFRNQHGATPS